MLSEYYLYYETVGLLLLVCYGITRYFYYKYNGQASFLNVLSYPAAIFAMFLFIGLAANAWVIEYKDIVVNNITNLSDTLVYTYTIAGTELSYPYLMWLNIGLAIIAFVGIINDLTAGSIKHITKVQ